MTQIYRTTNCSSSHLMLFADTNDTIWARKGEEKGRESRSDEIQATLQLSISSYSVL